MTVNPSQVTIAVVGDIHDLWGSEDETALKKLGVDLVLFVGDFGNESVEVVRLIAAIKIPKAAIAGNHDAWYTATDWGRQKSPYDHSKEDRVQQQLDLLGEAHVGYGKLDFPQFQLSVVGSRPFSWGGPKWKNSEFYRDRYGVNNFDESTAKIIAAAQETAYNSILFIGHNGPYGLGDKPEDSCGKDWQPIGGDFGDPDFTAALSQIQASGKAIPLVTFGHMHHRLRNTKAGERKAFNEKDGTVYLNAASVPRIIETGGDRLRNFSLVHLEDGVVAKASLVWLGRDYTVVSEQVLYQRQGTVAQPALSRS